MNKNKHLILEERNIIEQRLNEKKSFRSIACELGKDPTTIAKEVKNHIQFKKTGCYGRPFNDCLIRRDCATQRLCGNRKCNRYCCFCKSHPCSSICPDYQQQICYKLTKPPYVCNGCNNRRSCTLEKRTYSAIRAQKEYGLGKIIVVADKGINSQTVRGASKEMKDYVLSEVGYTVFDSGFKIKSRVISTNITVTNVKGKKVKVPSDQKQVNTLIMLSELSLKEN